MKTGRLRGCLANVALAAGAVLVGFLLVEGAFRIFPSWLPRGTYGWGRTDPELGMNVVGGRVIYNRARFLERRPNSLGFLDVEHDREKPPGVLRVGFFGDSYVESMQVALEESFFRLLPDTLAGQPMEYLAFGIGNWGTVHSWINFHVQAPRFDLDAIGYVFTENDMGDNSLLLHQARGHDGPPKPYARLIEGPPGFEVAWIDDQRVGPLWYRGAKVLQRLSLTAQIVNSRLRLLRQVGVRPPAGNRVGDFEERAAPGEAAPSEQAIPSTWPSRYLDDARQIGRRLLGRWAQDARAQGRHFFVFYVPRTEGMLREDRSPEDSWRAWLQATCEELGIPLVDPFPAMRRRSRAGVAMYGDHWTPAGHQVVAEELERYLRGWVIAARAEPGAP